MAKDITLTPAEKLNLLMLCDIYESQGAKGEFNPKFIREAIYSGNTWGLGWAYPGVFDMSDTPGSIVTETSNILSMWWRLELEYDRLTEEDKKWLVENAKPYGENVHFDGFSGNDETHYMGVAQFLVEQLGRFEGFKGRDFNAHFPNLDMHRRMLAVFERTQREAGFQPFTVAQLANVLTARKHPDRR